MDTCQCAEQMADPSAPIISLLSCTSSIHIGRYLIKVADSHQHSLLIELFSLLSREASFRKLRVMLNFLNISSMESKLVQPEYRILRILYLY